MSEWIDDLARALAGPTPRRDALRLIGTLFLGSFFAALGVEKASAQSCSPSCPGNQHCCPGYGKSNFCAPQQQTCCANTTCVPPRVCCGSGATAVCCENKETCSNGRCSASRE